MKHESAGSQTRTGRRLWLILFTSLFLGVIAVFLISQHHLIEYLENISLKTIVALIAVILLFNIFNGLQLRTLAEKFGAKLTAMEWLGLPFVTAMGNYITPFAGGMFARAAYLKYRHSFPYATFASVMAATYLIYGWVTGIAGLSALFLDAQRPSLFREMAVFFAGTILVISFFSMFPAIRIPGSNRIVLFLNSSFEGWGLVRRDAALLIRLAAYMLATILLNGLSFWLAFAALSGNSVPFGISLLISIFFSLSIFIRITPGNLGVSEGIATVASEILGMGAGMGFMASLLIRAASLIPIFTLGPLFSFLLTGGLTGGRYDDEG